MSSTDGRHPILAYGRTNDATVAASSAIAENVFETNKNTGWTTDDYAFMSESDDSEAEYLGKITDVTSYTITTTYGLIYAKGGSAKIWISTYEWVAPFVISGPPSNDFDDGIVESETLDGLIHRVKVRDSREYFTLSFPQIYRVDWSLWRAFYEETSGVNFGLENCVLGAYDYSRDLPITATVTIAGVRSPFTESSLDVASLSIRLLIVSLWTYPS